MGCVIGKALLKPEVYPFINIPQYHIIDFWETFQDISDGFALSLKEFQETIRISFKDYMDYNDEMLNSLSKSLFLIYDDDFNLLVDSLEFLSSMALVSGMSTQEKIYFLFGLYDFEENYRISMDEFIFGLRVCISGLNKISSSLTNIPTHDDIDALAARIFYENVPSNSEEEIVMDKEKFTNVVLNCPELFSWLQHFSDFEDTNDGILTSNEGKDCITFPLPPTNIKMNYGPKDIEFDKIANSKATRNTNLELSWVYGRNCKGVANRPYYTPNGDLMYAAGAIIVKQNSTKKQSFFMEHLDYVTCFVVHKDDIAASAETGIYKNSKIHIWSVETLENLASLNNIHENGTSILDFSPSGKLLASVGVGDHPSIAIYNWKERSIIFSSVCSSSFVLACHFLGSDDLIGTCGDCFVHFWSNTSTSVIYKKSVGVFGRKKFKKQVITCIKSCDEHILAGSSSGEIHIFEGRTCVRSIKSPHHGSITDIQFDSESSGTCVSTSNGKIFFLTKSLEITKSFDISSYGALDNTISSIQWKSNINKILVGLTCSDIVEICDLDGSFHGSHMSGHQSLHVWGLDVNPCNDCHVVTAGTDKTLRIWDVHKHSLVRMVNLDSAATCVSYNTDGTLIAVGFGRESRDAINLKEGAFNIIQEQDLTIAYQGRDSKFALMDCKFSMDGKILAFSNNKCIHIYDASNYSLIGRTKEGDGSISHFDFGRAQESPKATCLRSNYDTDEIMCWTLHGKEVPLEDQTDMYWETESCTHDRDGMKDFISDPTKIAACCSSNSKEIKAFVDNLGLIHLPRNFSFRGHSELIGNIKFSNKDDFIFTVGANDCCLFQWRYSLDSVQSKYFEEENQLYLERRDEKSVVWELVKNNKMVQDDNVVPPKPWQKTIVAPSNPVENKDTEVDNDLVLEWIHGYNGSKCRNNLFYGSRDEVIYNVGKTTVVYNISEHKQIFYQAAKDEITCLALHPSKSICALGEIGATPSIYIFDNESLDTLRVISGCHKLGISCIKFDSSGKLLVSVGYDDTLTVHDWESNTLKAYSKSYGRTHDVDFFRNGSGFVQCGAQNLLCFWTIEGKNLNCRNAFIDDCNDNKIQSFLSIGWIRNDAIVGSSEGYLYRFHGRKFENKVKAHHSEIHAIHSFGKGIVTGGKDGIVSIWDELLVCQSSTDGLKSEIKSVLWSTKSKKLLMGTSNNEIWEFSSNDEGFNAHHNTPLLSSHFDENLCGLAINPTKSHFLTVGDDKMLRIWDIFDHKIILSKLLCMKARACAYSHDGSMIAIGFGTAEKISSKDHNGKWAIFNATDCSIMFEIRDSRRYITEIKWSRDGKHIAIGSFDNYIYIYSIRVTNDVNSPLQISLSSKIEHHNELIKHLDFSMDGSYIQSNDSSELCFFETDTGINIPAASRLKDVIWETQTCVLGFSVKGIWPIINDETSITSVDRNLDFETVESSVIAAGDNFGRLKLFRYPCVSAKASCKQYKAHVGAIAKARWTMGDSHLVTIGMDDKAVMVWRHEVDDMVFEEPDFEDSEDNDCTTELKFFLPTAKLDINKNYDRPWISSMVEPSKNTPLPPPSPPARHLELVYVHGFQSECNLVYNSHNEIVYAASSTCIIYDQDNHSQRYFRKHDDLISSLATSPSRRMIASADFSSCSKLKVWDAQTCNEIITLGGYHKRGIIYLSFASDSKRIITVGAEDDQIICVWRSLSAEWNDGALEANYICLNDNETVLFAEFLDLELSQQYMIATGGINHMKFWIINGIDLIPSLAIYESIGSKQHMTCGTSCWKTFVTGTGSGQIYVWGGRNLTKVIEAHEGSINSIYFCKGGLVTGCEDGCIRIWSCEFDQTKSFQISALDSSIKSIDAHMDSSQKNIMKLLVGTNSSEIYEVTTAGGSNGVIKIHDGHCRGELWGLAMHPINDDVYCTCGDDGTLRIWSFKSNSVMKMIKIENRSLRAVTWSHDGRHLIVGCGGYNDCDKDEKGNEQDGSLMIYDFPSLEKVLQFRDAYHWISEVKFSPNASCLAAASADHKIYIYERSKNNYVLRAVAEKHNDVIHSFDFSSDSQMIQSCSMDGEYVFFNADTGEHITRPSQVKDLHWETQNSTFGWNVQGVWPSMKKYKDFYPTCSDKSKDENILVAGGSNGVIKIFSFPVVSKETSHLSYCAHVDEIAKCRFSCDHSYMISVGKIDRCIFVWKVVDESQQD